ncbi:MAG: HAD family hydrolase, partial [Prevotella sp.]|nr:HAD family hydrolase [Prevotella sp.]
MNTNTKIIIFDFDGTLADTRQAIVKKQQQTMRELQLPDPTEQERMHNIGLTLK